jgi:ParB family chromosome partitioning protein
MKREPLATNIEISMLELGAFSPRMGFDVNYVAKLAEDIQAEGQLKPIMIRADPAHPNKYQVIDGEHRIRALQKLGQPLVRAEIHALSDEEAYYRAMRINQLHGKSLEELEEACHISKMMALFNLTQTQIGERFSRSQDWVSQRVSLATQLAPKVEEYVTRRLVTSSHAIEMSGLPKDQQEKVLEKVAGANLSTRATRGLVQAVKEAGTAEQKEKVLGKSMKLYSSTFKDPKQMTTALLTIQPDDDFLAKTKEIKTEAQAAELFDEALEKKAEPYQTETCPGCGKHVRIDWVKRELSWV